MNAQQRTEMIKEIKTAGIRYNVGVKSTMALRARIEELSNVNKDYSKEDVELCKYFYSAIPSALWSEFFSMLNYSPERQMRLHNLLGTGMRSDPYVMFYPGEYIVLLSNPNSHLYPLNRPLRMVDKKTGSLTTLFAITPAGVCGNHVSSRISTFRAATNEEIALFVAEEVYLKHCSPYLSAPERQEELTNFLEEATAMIATKTTEGDNGE